MYSFYIVIDFPFALSNAILKYELSKEYKAVNYPGSNKNGVHTGTCCSPYTVVLMVVEKILSSRLMMNSRWLWNSHQRHEFFWV